MPATLVDSNVLLDLMTEDAASSPATATSWHEAIAASRFFHRGACGGRGLRLADA
jgi:hypothetical protein